MTGSMKETNFKCRHQAFYRVMHVVLARFCYRKSSVRPSVCPSVCDVDASSAYGLDDWWHADDCQIYTSTPVDDDTATVERFSRCIGDVEAWLSSSRLRLNPAKTQVLWLGSQVSAAQARCSRRSNPDNIRQNRRLST